MWYRLLVVVFDRLCMISQCDRFGVVGNDQSGCLIGLFQLVRVGVYRFSDSNSGNMGCMVSFFFYGVFSMVLCLIDVSLDILEMICVYFFWLLLCYYFVWLFRFGEKCVIQWEMCMQMVCYGGGELCWGCCVGVWLILVW